MSVAGPIPCSSAQTARCSSPRTAASTASGAPKDQRPPSIQRVSAAGEVEVLVTEIEGIPLSAPNDLAFGPDGKLYFTDPACGFSRTEPLKPGYIFSLDPDGTGRLVVEAGPTFPNGVTVEADGNVVWVESLTRAVRRYRIDTGKVEDICVLEDPDAIPDGLKPATNGDLYIATVLTGGVNVVGADGTDKGLLKGFGDYVSNVQFRGSTLYVTDIGGGTGDDSSSTARSRAQSSTASRGSSSSPGRSAREGGAQRAAATRVSVQGRFPATSLGAEMCQRTEGTVSEFQEEPRNIVDELVSGEMTRDQFIRRATMLGISATAIGGMLTAAGKATAADLKVAGSLAGGTVNLLVPAEGAEKGIQDKFGEIKSRFGIDVEVRRSSRSSQREAEPERQGADRHVRPHLGARVHGRCIRGRRLLHAAQHARQDEGSGGIQLPTRLRGRRAEVHRILQHRQRHVRWQDALPDPGSLRRPDHPLLPQGPVRQGWHLGSHHLDPVPGSGEGAQRQRDRRQHDDRQVGRRLDVPRRLVHAVHAPGRPADERLAAEEGLHAPPHQRRSRRGAPAHGRLRQFATKGVNAYDFTVSTDAFRPARRR